MIFQFTGQTEEKNHSFWIDLKHKILLAFSEKLKKKVRENYLRLKSKLIIHLFGGTEMLVKSILNLEKFTNNF